MMQRRILVVDDDIGFLEALSSILKRNFQVFMATGIAEAKQVLMSEDVDAVCSDFHMRDGTGLELLEWLREEGNMITFLMLSGTEDVFLTNMVKRYGATFCSKTDCNLIERIKTLTASKPI